MPHHDLSWRRIDRELRIIHGRAETLVPPLVHQWLSETVDDELSDPATDLLRLEHHLRAATRRADTTTATRAELQRPTPRGSRTSRWRAAWPRRREPITVAEQHDRLGDDPFPADRITVVREFISTLAARGLADQTLTRAAQGWARGTKPLDTVSVYADTNVFLFSQPRRAIIGPNGTQVLDGIEAWGTHWRRDPDDDLDAGPDQSGTWTLGVIPDTGEIYAVERVTRAVWRLGSGYGIGQAAVLLTRLAPRMREPNSLLLAAAVIARTTPHVHEAQPCSPPDQTGHATADAAPNGTRYVRQNIRRAVEAVRHHLDAHPELDVTELAILNPVPAPRPRLTTGSHLPTWCGFDVLVRCATPSDVLAWLSTAPKHSGLSVFVPSTGAAQLRAVVRMRDGEFVLTADATSVLPALRIPANRKTPVTVAELTHALDATGAQVPLAASDHLVHPETS